MFLYDVLAVTLPNPSLRMLQSGHDITVLLLQLLTCQRCLSCSKHLYKKPF